MKSNVLCLCIFVKVILNINLYKFLFQRNMGQIIFSCINIFSLMFIFKTKNNLFQNDCVPN